MNFRNQIWCALAIAAMQQATAAKAADVPTSPAVTEEFDRWIATLWPILEATPQMSNFRELVEVANRSMRLAHLEDPWALQSQTFRQDHRPLYPDGDTTRLTDYSISNGVNFTNAYGVAASTSVVDTFGRHEDILTTSALGVPERANQLPRSHTLTGQLAYDLVQGGANGAGRMKQRSDEATARQTKYLTLDQILQYRISVYGQLADLYVTICDIKQLERVTALVNRTVQIGKIQLDAKTLSYKDFLTFIGLANNFESQLANLEANRTRQLNQLLYLSTDKRDAVQAAADQIKACTVDIDRLVNHGLELKLAPEPLGKRLPSTEAALAAVDAAQAGLQVARYATMMSLQPYVAGSYVAEVDHSPVNGSTTLGVNLTWTLPFERSPSNLRITKMSLDAATELLTATSLQNQAQVASLHQQIEAQQRIVKTLKVTLDNSDLLVKTTEAQLVTGSIDALSYTNAYLEKVTALQALLDSYGGLKKIVFQAELYTAEGR